MQLHFSFSAALLLSLTSGPATTSALREALQMGTWSRVEVEASSRAESLRLADEALAAVDRVESLLSEWRPDSELSWLVRSEPGIPASLSPELATLLAPAFEIAEASGWAFDPGVAPVAAAWDIHGQFRMPTKGDIEAARGAAAGLGLEVGPGARDLCRNSPRASIDTGGFGKGAGLDEAAAALRSRGVARALLDLGGQTTALGGPHRVAIAHPLNRDRPVGWLTLSDASVSTSGNSERSGSIDGAAIGHILDPRRGVPAPAEGSVTVRARSGLLADALSTALFVLGPEAGLTLAQRWPDVEALYLLPLDDGRLEARFTPGFASSLEWLPGALRQSSEMAGRVAP